MMIIRRTNRLCPFLCVIVGLAPLAAGQEPRDRCIVRTESPVREIVVPEGDLSPFRVISLHQDGTVNVVGSDHLVTNAPVQRDALVTYSATIGNAVAIELSEGMLQGKTPNSKESIEILWQLEYQHLLPGDVMIAAPGIIAIQVRAQDTIELVDCSDGSVFATLPSEITGIIGFYCEIFRLSSDMVTLSVVDKTSNDTLLHSIDLTASTLFSSQTTAAVLTGMEFSPDGESVIHLGFERSGGPSVLQLRGIPDLRGIAQMELHSPPRNGAVFTRDGKNVILFGGDTLHLLDSKTLALAGTLTLQGERIVAVKPSWNGELLYAGTHEGLVHELRPRWAPPTSAAAANTSDSTTGVSSELRMESIGAELDSTPVAPAINPSPPVRIPFPEMNSRFAEMTIQATPRDRGRRMLFMIMENNDLFRMHLPEAYGVEGQRFRQQPTISLLSFPQGANYHYEVLGRSDSLYVSAPPIAESGINYEIDMPGQMARKDLSLPRESAALAYQSRSENTIILLDLKSGSELDRISAENKLFSADNDFITLSEDNSFIILADHVEPETTRLTCLHWGQPENEQQVTLKGRTSRILLAEDGSFLVRQVLRPESEEQHSGLEVLRTSDFKMLDSISLNGTFILDSTLTTDQQSVALLTGTEIQFLDLLPFQSRGSVPVPEQQGVAFCFHPDQRLIYVVTEAGSLYQIGYSGDE